MSRGHAGHLPGGNSFRADPARRQRQDRRSRTCRVVTRVGLAYVAAMRAVHTLAERKCAFALYVVQPMEMPRRRSEACQVPSEGWAGLDACIFGADDCSATLSHSAYGCTASILQALRLTSGTWALGAAVVLARS